MSQELVLNAHNLKQHYHVKQGLFKPEATVKAVDGVSFTLDRGKTLAVVGESGCGKSTLGRMLTMIETPTEGQLNFLGEDLLSLSKEQQKIDSLKEETKKIGGAVDTLEKLRQIDEELLKKYSKVFFLNENYVPVRLSEIKNQYLYSEKETKYLLSDVLLFLTDMIDDALAQNIDIYVKSAYRSFNEQDNLKGDYTVLYGETTASQFSADQGYSEHQLGTTVDFITKGLNGQLPGFENTEAYEWLTQNAYKYGFALSYPEGNP